MYVWTILYFREVRLLEWYSKKTVNPVMLPRRRKCRGVLSSGSFVHDAAAEAPEGSGDVRARLDLYYNREAISRFRTVPINASRSCPVLRASRAGSARPIGTEIPRCNQPVGARCRNTRCGSAHNGRAINQESVPNAQGTRFVRGKRIAGHDELCNFAYLLFLLSASDPFE